MKPIVPLKLQYLGLLLITLLFPFRDAQATVADTLTVQRVVDYAVTALIEQDEENRENERTGKAYLNEYTITLDLKNWMDEQGKQTKILDAAQFSTISKKLQDFNRRPDQLRMYVVLVNDYEVKFKAKLDASILKDGFKWNDLQQHPEQQKTVQGLWQKTASIIEGVATALKAAGFDERVVYFYSHLRVEEYNQTPHFFHYDRLKFFGARLPAQESKIRQHVKTTNAEHAKRVDLAVSSLITSIEAVVDNGYTSNSSLVAFANSPSHALPDNDFSKISAEDFTRFAQLADAALGKSAIKWDQTKKPTDYKHVNIPEAFKKSTASQLRDFEIESLEDKLRYLSEVTNIHFYVTLAPFWYDLNQQQRDRFAEEVYKRTRKLSGLEKVVLITIPFYNQQYLNMAALTTDPIKTGSVAQPGIYAKGVDIDLAFVASTIGGPYEFVSNAYKHLAKPYSNFVYGIQADGTVKMLQGRAEAYVKGFEAIEELVLLRDKNIDHLADVYSVHTPPDFNKPPYIGARADPRRYYQDLDTYRRYLVALQEAIDNPKWEVDEDGKRLKEPFVKTHHKNFVKEFISSDAAFLSKFGSNVNWPALLTEQSLVGKQYDFRLASRYVKPAADKFWFIPLVPNAVCLTWAKAEGDYVLADQAAVDLTLEISINLATYGAGKSLTSGLQLVKGTRAYTKVATNWIVLSGREVSEAVVERAVRRYSLNAAEKAVLTGCSDDVLASLASEGNQKLIAGLSKDDFLRYIRTLADATGMSDLVVLGNLVSKMGQRGVQLLLVSPGKYVGQVLRNGYEWTVFTIENNVFIAKAISNNSEQLLRIDLQEIPALETALQTANGDQYRLSFGNNQTTYQLSLIAGSRINALAQEIGISPQLLNDFFDLKLAAKQVKDLSEQWKRAGKSMDDFWQLKQEWVNSGISAVDDQVRTSFFNRLTKLESPQLSAFLGDYKNASNEFRRALSGMETSIQPVITRPARGGITAEKLMETWKKVSTSVLRTDMEFLVRFAKLSPTQYELQVANGLVEVVDKTKSAVVATVSKTEARCVAGKEATKDWNEFLNVYPPLAKYNYIVDGRYTFETDASGRVVKVSGELNGIERGRNYTEQGGSVSLKGGTTGMNNDDGGHLIANILFGPGEQINYVPMKANLNRGAWKSMEERWAKAIEEDHLTVKIQIIPLYNGASNRPYKFIVREDVGGKQDVLNFQND